MPTTSHHPDDGAAFNINFQAVNSSQPHANVASESIMSQSNSDTDPESTDEREEEHDIKHFSLDTRGDCLDSFITYNIAGYKHRPSYEEILAQQDDSSEQITAMMIQSATQSSNTSEEGTSSSAVESTPIQGRGSLVQQVAKRVEAYMRYSNVSDAIMPRIMDTIPPSLWFRAIRATVAHITASEPPDHVLDFMEEDIPPATTDLNDHNALTNLWAQRVFTEEELTTLLKSSLEIDIEPRYFVLTQQLNAINRKMWDVYRTSTFLVHSNNSHKHPARTLITDAAEATNTKPLLRTLMGELKKRAAREIAQNIARANRESKGDQPANPPKIKSIPHPFSVGAWLLDATKNNTRARKTARKTTANAVAQTTIDDFFLKESDNEDNTKSKRFKDDKHALTSASIDDEKIAPNEWVPLPPEPQGTRTIYSNAFTTSSRTRCDEIAETINLIDETIAMCKPDIPGSINMIVDSGASHVLIRQEHAHVLQHVTCDNSKCFATIKCAKQGAILTAIGLGSLTIERFRIQAFICRNDELQHSLLGLNPLTTKGCTAEFTNKYFRLNHSACLQPILVGYKHHRPTLWRVIIPPPNTTAIPRAIASDPFLAHSDDDTTTASLKRDEKLDGPGSSITLAPTQNRTPIYAFQDFSYAEDDYVTSGTYKAFSTSAHQKPRYNTKGASVEGTKGARPIGTANATDQARKTSRVTYNGSESKEASSQRRP